MSFLILFNLFMWPLVIGLFALIGGNLPKALICFSISAVVFLIGYRISQKEEAEKRRQKEEEFEEHWLLKCKFNSVRESVENQIPENAEPVRKGEYLMWCTDQSLCWFPIELSVGEENFKLVQIPKDQIYFYVESGDVNTIVNGTGGHSSYSFLTGFHGKINPINVSTTIQDTRCIQLYYKENGADNRFDLAFEDLNYLRRILPGKDYETVARSQASVPHTTSEKTTSDKLKELSDMLANELITQQEYDEARRSLVAKLMQ